MTRYNGINHLALATADMDAAIRFWRDLLGMRLVAGLGSAKYRHYCFEISPRDMIAFFEWPQVEPIPDKGHGYPVAGPFVFDHVAIGVRDSKDLWELKDKLEAAGFWASEVMDHGFIHSLYSFDPNGAPIEFSYSLPEADLRSRPVMAGPAPSAVTREGPEPQEGKRPPVAEPAPPGERTVYPGEGRALTGAPPLI